MRTYKICIATILLLLISVSPVLSKNGKNPYSYLSRPPVKIEYGVQPDKAIYNRDEVVTFNILATLDTLRCDRQCNYGLYFGDLSSMLANSILIDSNVLSYYRLNIKASSVMISFKVKMKQKFSPPFIEIQSVREAPVYSRAKKQFSNIIIDEYATQYVTSRAYSKVRNSDVNKTDD